MVRAPAGGALSRPGSEAAPDSLAAMDSDTAFLDDDNTATEADGLMVHVSYVFLGFRRHRVGQPHWQIWQRLQPFPENMKQFAVAMHDMKCHRVSVVHSSPIYSAHTRTF